MYIVKAQNVGGDLEFDVLSDHMEAVAVRHCCSFSVQYSVISPAVLLSVVCNRTGGQCCINSL